MDTNWLYFLFEEIVKKFTNINIGDAMWNASLGLVVGIVACMFLREDAKRGSSDYVFEKRDMVLVIAATILGMVFFVPLFPFPEKGFLDMIAAGVCFLILLVTSVMDEKSGYFTLGYQLVGLFIEVLFLVAGIVAKQVEFTPKEILSMGVVLTGTFGLGICCYSMGDAGLLAMVFLSYMVTLDSSFWIFAFLFTLLISSTTFVLRYAVCFIKMRKSGRMRKPFTMHILIGTLITFCLLR